MRLIFGLNFGGLVSESLWFAGRKGLVLAAAVSGGRRSCPVLWTPTLSVTRCCQARQTQLCQARCQRVLEVSNAAAAFSLAVIGGSLSV